MGVRNHREFIFYIYSQFILLLGLVIGAVWIIIQEILHSSQSRIEENLILDGIEEINSPWPLYIAAFQIIIICCFFIWRLGMLVYVQTINLITGLTTNERLSRRGR